MRSWSGLTLVLALAACRDFGLTPAPNDQPPVITGFALSAARDPISDPNDANAAPLVRAFAGEAVTVEGTSLTDPGGTLRVTVDGYPARALAAAAADGGAAAPPGFEVPDLGWPGRVEVVVQTSGGEARRAIYFLGPGSLRGEGLAASAKVELTPTALAVGGNAIVIADAVLKRFLVLSPPSADEELEPGGWSLHPALETSFEPLRVPRVVSAPKRPQSVPAIVWDLVLAPDGKTAFASYESVPDDVPGETVTGGVVAFALCGAGITKEWRAVRHARLPRSAGIGRLALTGNGIIGALRTEVPEVVAFNRSLPDNAALCTGNPAPLPTLKDAGLEHKASFVLEPATPVPLVSLASDPAGLGGFMAGFGSSAAVLAFDGTRIAKVAPAVTLEGCLVADVAFVPASGAKPARFAILDSFGRLVLLDAAAQAALQVGQGALSLHVWVPPGGGDARLLVATAWGIEVVDPYAARGLGAIPTSAPPLRLAHAAKLVYATARDTRLMVVDPEALAQIGEVPLDLPVKSVAFDSEAEMSFALNPRQGAVFCSMGVERCEFEDEEDLRRDLEIDPALGLSLAGITFNGPRVALALAGQAGVVVHAGSESEEGTSLFETSRELGTVVPSDTGFVAVFRDGFTRLLDPGCPGGDPPSCAVKLQGGVVLADDATSPADAKRLPPTQAVAWAADARRLFVADHRPETADGFSIARAFDEKGALVGSLLAPRAPSDPPGMAVYGAGVAASRDGRVVAAVLRAGPSREKIWYRRGYLVVDGDLAHACPLFPPNVGVTAVAVSPDGRQAFAATAFGRVFAASWAEGAVCGRGREDVLGLRLVFDAQEKIGFQSLLPSPDGASLLIAADDPSHQMFLLR